MHRAKSYFLLLFLIVQSLLVRATKIEALDFGYGANQYTAILQDDRGLVWLGSNRGLFFYDGYQAHPFQLGSYIYSIISAEPDLLCFGSEEGLCLLRLSTEQVVPTALDTLSLGQVRSCLSKNGVIWAGTEKMGLIAYSLETDSWKSLYKGMGESYAMTLAGERLYIGGEEGLGYYHLEDEQYYSIILPEELDTKLVNSLLWDEQRNCLWIGTIGKLFQYTPATNHFISADLNPTSFKCITFNVDHLLMIGTDNGLIEYNPETQHATYLEHDVRYRHSLTSNIIWSIYQDCAHNIWMGTDQGVSLLHYSSYYRYVPILYLTTFSSLPNNEGNRFTCITRDNKGGYWFGGTNGVIWKKEGEEPLWFRKGSLSHPLPHNRIRRIYEDKQNQLWIATDEGILRFDRDIKQFVAYPIMDVTKQYDAKWAYDIIEDRKGRVWVATYSGGLFVMDRESLLQNTGQKCIVSDVVNDVVQGAEHIPNHVFYLLEDGKGNLWVGHKYGLSFVDTETMRAENVPLLNEKGEISNVYVNNLTMGEDGNLWYTVKGTLCKVNRASGQASLVSTFGGDDEVIGTMIYKDGCLWMTLNNKTLVYDTSSSLVKELNLPNNDYQAIYYDNDKSELIFGGNDGLLYLQPETAMRYKADTQPYIVSVVSNNKRLKPDIDYLRKEYGSKVYDSFAPSTLQLTFEVSDFSYAESNTLSYQYQLEGYDDKWTSLSPGNNRIVFLNLSPRKYVLNIRNGGESAVVSSYYFEIRPPWYFTGWAYLFYIFIALLLLFLFVKYLFDKNKKRYERLEREKSLELSNMKIDFFTNISHELKTPLSLIIAPLSKITTEIRDTAVGEQLQVVHQNALRLNALIQQILDFKRTEYKEEEAVVRSRTNLNQLLTMVVGSFRSVAESRQIQIELKTQPESVWVNVDVFKMESVLYNLLSNAIKFVPNNTGRVVVELRKNEVERKLYITIADNGVGIPAEDLKLIWLRLYQGGNKQLNPQGTGIGLYLVKRFVTLHGGVVNIDSEVNKGTVATIELPFAENLLENSTVYHNAAQTESNEKVEKQTDARPSLLIIDDNEELLSFLISAFGLKYQCYQAKDGKEGLDIALKYYPDVVIVDEMMPVMTGMEFCGKLRKSTQMATTPIIMLTAKDDTATELNSMKSGVDVFMSKPFDLHRLTLRIEQLIDSKRQLQEKIHLDQMIDTTIDIKEELLSDDERLMKQVLQVIEDRMSDSSFNVTQLCNETGIGSKRLLRMLKKQTNMSPVNFIRQIRLRKAAVLLQQGKFTVSEVMYMVGFSHPSYFTKSFTEEIGVSPKEYMDKNKV